MVDFDEAVKAVFAFMADPRVLSVEPMETEIVVTVVDAAAMEALAPRVTEAASPTPVTLRIGVIMRG